MTTQVNAKIETKSGTVFTSHRGFDIAAGEHRELEMTFDNTPSWKRSYDCERGFARVRFSTHMRNAYLGIAVEEHYDDAKTHKHHSRQTMVTIPNEAVHTVFEMLRDLFMAKCEKCGSYCEIESNGSFNCGACE